MPIPIPDQIQEMRDAGALFAVNHSAGKDSQAMLIALREAGIPEVVAVVQVIGPEWTAPRIGPIHTGREVHSLIDQLERSAGVPACMLGAGQEGHDRTAS